MTYKEKIDQLGEKVTKAWSKLSEEDKELTFTNNFADIDSVPGYNKAYKDWYQAQSNFNDYISWLNGRGLNLNDEISN